MPMPSLTFSDWACFCVRYTLYNSGILSPNEIAYSEDLIGPVEHRLSTDKKYH